MDYKKIKNRIHSMGNKEQAMILQRFFKTGKGEYGEGDIFLGIKVPPLRALAVEHYMLEFSVLQELLNSPVHEERAFAAFALVIKYKKAKKDEKIKEEIVRFYLNNYNRAFGLIFFCIWFDIF